MRRSLIALAVLAVGCYRVPPTKTLLGEIQFRLRAKTLPSGMRIVLEKAPGTGRVAVLVGVSVGSSSDPVGKEGLAHLVEHLTFRARPNGKLTIKELHEFLGSSDHNGSTEFDLTTFQSFGVAESVVPMVKIEANRLSSPLSGIDARVFDLEREVVRNELRLKHENGIAGAALGTLQSIVFAPTHPYARPIGGTMASLDGLTLEDATAFAQAHYQPKNVILVVTGDFDEAMLERELLDALPPNYLLGNSPQALPFLDEVLPPAPPMPVHPPVVHAGVDRTQLLLAWPAPRDDGGPELIALQRGLQQALGRPWKDTDIGFASVQLLRGAHASMLVASVTLKLGLHPEDSLAEVRAGIGKGRAISELIQLLTRGRSGAPGAVLSTIRANDNLIDRAQRRLEGTCYANDPRVISSTLRNLAVAGSGKLQAQTEQWLDDKNLRAVIVEPLQVQDGPQPAAKVGVGLRPINVQIPLEEVRKLARGPQLDAVKERVLSNGLKVIAVRRPELPIVSVALALPGGRARGPVGASELSGLYVPPARRRSEAAGNVYLFESERESLPDATLLQWTAGNGNLPNLLALAANFMTDAERVADEIKDPEGFLAHLEARAEVRQSREFNAALFRGAQLGMSMPVAEANAVLKNAPEWARQVYVPGQAALVIVGDVDLDQVEQTAEQFLGGWKNEQPLLPLAAPPDQTSRPTQVLVNNLARQSLVSAHLGCLVPSGGDRMTSAILSKLIGERLDRLWRQQLGLSYGVQDSWSVSAAGSTIEIASVLDARRLTSALRTLKQHWEETALTPEEIDRARWGVAADRVGVGATDETLAHFLALSRLRGMSALEAIRAEARVAEITPSELQAAFEVCRGSTVLRLDGDEALIRAALKDAAQ